MADSTAPIHSGGRGGAGNIKPDPIQYTDGAVIREGVEGVGDPEFSTGRGGAGNIIETPAGVAAGPRTSQEIIPEVNQIPAEGHENFHTGRGGAANVHKEKYGGHTKDPNRRSFIDKAKAFVKSKIEKKKTEEPKKEEVKTEEPKKEAAQVAEPTATTTTTTT